MVLHKRLDYGFYGYQVPPAPRGFRSARRRRSFWKNFDDNKICAFNLLASDAPKLLLEREGCPSSTNSFSGKEHTTVIKASVKKEQLDVDNTVTINTSINKTRGNTFLFELISQPPVLDHSSQKFLQDCLEKAGSPEKVINGEKHIEPSCFSKKVEVGSDCSLEKEGEKKIKAEPQSIGKVSNCWFDMSSSEGPVVWDPEPSAPVSSTNNLKLPFCTDHVPSGSYPVYRNGVKLVFRDNDGNSRCIQPTTANKAYRPLLRNGNRRIRKLVVSKYWKVTSKLKNEEHFSADAEVTHAFLNRKNGYERLRSQKDYPFKKRKFYDHSSLSNSGGLVGSDKISGSPGNDFKEDASGLGGKLHEATRTSASGAVQHSKKQSRDSHVKLKIKSFKVPEFFIEIPESATVGLLKRTVMEAVTTILGGEPRVGILLQGKKIGDDEKSLLQTGISHDNQLDSLGFALEPDSFQVSKPLFREGPQFLFRPQPITRCPPAPSIVHDIGQQGISDTLHDPPIMNSRNFVESDHDSIPSPPIIPIHRGATDSRALVAVRAMNAEAPSAVSLQKSKQAVAVHRRIRRPFSVAEVEALVEAVEKLGTGRWRDVKMQAFDNAKHRTYVDLKDKWKTLVHTARISPQQRRGESVPQELLDRVLTAHAYWSQQQAKHQLRQQEPALSRLL